MRLEAVGEVLADTVNALALGLQFFGPLPPPPPVVRMRAEERAELAEAMRSACEWLNEVCTRGDGPAGTPALPGRGKMGKKNASRRVLFERTIQVDGKHREALPFSYWSYEIEMSVVRWMDEEDFDRAVFVIDLDGPDGLADELAPTRRVVDVDSDWEAISAAVHLGEALEAKYGEQTPDGPRTLANWRPMGPKGLWQAGCAMPIETREAGPAVAPEVQALAHQLAEANGRNLELVGEVAALTRSRDTYRQHADLGLELVKKERSRREAAERDLAQVQEQLDTLRALYRHVDKERMELRDLWDAVRGTNTLARLVEPVEFWECLAQDARERKPADGKEADLYQGIADTLARMGQSSVTEGQDAAESA